ncbi:MAG: hypothetical protein K8E66_06625, partial [Phycisphaerales bacterium]|nr:hypothetical protein [Phycisphaerales bacterium]
MAATGASARVRFVSVRVRPLLAVLAVAGAAGCHPGMDQIDRRLARVIGDSAARTGLDAEPRIRPAPGVPSSRGSLYETSPATTNPAASDLSYTELDRGEPGTPEVVEGLNERLRNYALA